VAAKRIPPRFELKYVVPAAHAERVRQAVPATCHLDPFCEDAPQQRYAIGSLYLDSRDLIFHRQKTGRAHRRLKLRVRHYPDAPDAGAFLEIKRRVGDVILKRRRRLPPEADWGGIVCGDLAPAHPIEADMAATAALYGAAPMVYVHYRRQAWVSDVDEYARVTFDTALCYQPHQDWTLPSDETGLIPVDDGASLGVPGSWVIIELKFAERMPLWMESLTARFELYRRGFSKYCKSVEREWIDEPQVFAGKRVAASPFGPF
jgi:hypothetical protein